MEAKATAKKETFRGNTRRCAKCEEFKTLDNFYRSKTMPQGVGSYCKSCLGRHDHIIKLTERNLSLCSECQKCLKGLGCRYFRSKKTLRFQMAAPLIGDYWKGYYGANRDNLLAKRSRWSKENRCKGWASATFHNNFSGEKPEVCERCGGSGRIVAHHPDYTDPLTVEWLCNSCHLKEHRKTA